MALETGTEHKHTFDTEHKKEKYDPEYERQKKWGKMYGMDKFGLEKYGAESDKYRGRMGRDFEGGRKWDKWDKYGMDKHGMEKYDPYHRMRSDEYERMGYDKPLGFQEKHRMGDRYKHRMGERKGEMEHKKKMKRKWAPVTDFGKTKKHWIIRTELPGVPKHKIRVEVRGKELIIEGKRSKKMHIHHTKKGKAAETEKKGEGLLEKGKEAIKETLGTTDTKEKERKEKERKEKGKKDKKEKKEKKDLDKVKWMTKERGPKGKFKRRLALPEKAHPEKVEALYKDGILEVMLPRKKFHTEKDKEGHHNVHVPIH